jgi:hypothetical protein
VSVFPFLSFSYSDADTVLAQVDRDVERGDEPQLKVGKLGSIKSYASPTKKFVPSKSNPQTSLDFGDESKSYLLPYPSFRL